MPWLGTVTLVGVIVLVILVIVFIRRHSSDQTDAMMKKRAGEARIANRAEYVEGMANIPVALTLTATSLYYENPDLQARLDLDRIEEVEYDDELSTGHEVKDGKVLRLRSHGHTFEFILDLKSAPNWLRLLPPHRMGEPGNVGTQLI
jgi:hypothetical protein